MRWQSVRIPTATGTLLQGVLHGGIGRVMAVHCHRLGSGPDEAEGQLLRQYLASGRLPLLQLAFSGHGSSAGNLAATTYSSQMADLAAALDYLAGRHAQSFVLFGAGMGGSVALLCAARDERVRAVATLAATGRPADHRPDPATAPPLGPDFAVDADSHDVVQAAAVIRATCLIVHGALDREVPSCEAEDLAAALPNAGMELCLGGDHRMSSPVQLRPAMLRIAGFLQAAAERAMLLDTALCRRSAKNGTAWP